MTKPKPKKKTASARDGKHTRDEFHITTFTPVGLFGVRKKGDEEHHGVLAKGENLPGEPVHVTPRAGEPVLDLRPVYATNKGPAQVSSDDYRRGFEKTFGKKKLLN